MQTEAKEQVIVKAGDIFAKRDERSLPAAVPESSPMTMLDIAVRKGMDAATIKDLMDLQERWERNEARKAYHQAFANFKGEAVEVIRNKKVDAGPLEGKKYAELATVVNAVTPALSKHGLSAAWSLSKDDKDWLEVTCTITHILGHSESVSMGAMPDTGGAKNGIQARASTVSYLERYTLMAATGLAAQGQDDDGNGTAGIPNERYLEIQKSIESTTEEKPLMELWQTIAAECKEKRDVDAYENLKAEVTARRKAIKK